jgi:hypothetical protein
VDRSLPQRLEGLQSPELAIILLARVGSLYDCIWNSLRQTTPQYFTAQQQALLARLNGVAAQLSGERLPVVASILGDEKMLLLLKDFADPTDPETDESRRRHIAYRAGAFRVGP